MEFSEEVNDEGGNVDWVIGARMEKFGKWLGMIDVWD